MKNVVRLYFSKKKFICYDMKKVELELYALFKPDEIAVFLTRCRSSVYVFVRPPWRNCFGTFALNSYQAFSYNTTRWQMKNVRGCILKFCVLLVMKKCSYFYSVSPLRDLVLSMYSVVRNGNGNYNDRVSSTIS